MVMHKIAYSPIGIIHSPFKKPEGTPIQPSAAKGVRGEVDLFPEFAEGLEDLAGFSHIILLYHFHLSKKYHLKVKPFLDDEYRGLFATRAPARPNAIGLSVVRLTKIDKARDSIVAGNINMAIRLVSEIEVLMDKNKLTKEQRRPFDYDLRSIKTSIKLATLT